MTGNQKSSERKPGFSSLQFWVQRRIQGQQNAEHVLSCFHVENLEVPGIKALLSAGEAEALLVATGLAGVGTRALRLLLDGDWRAVKGHRYRDGTHKQKERVGTQTQQDFYFLFTLSPAPKLQSLSSKARANTSVRAGISFTCQTKCLSDCQLQNTALRTDAGAQNNTTLTRLHSSSRLEGSSPSLFFFFPLRSSRHNSSQSLLCQSRAKS